MTELATPPRANAESTAARLAYQRAAATRVRHALSNIQEGQYAKAYSKLDEACGFLVSLLELAHPEQLKEHL